MLLHDLLACQSFLCLFLSPKSFYLKVRFFHEMPTTKFSLSSSEMSLWQTEQTDTKPFLFSCSSWSRSFQDPSGGDSSQVSHCRALRTWVTHVSWHNGRLSLRQWREVSKLRGILFLIAARSPLFIFFPLTLMTLLFDLMNYANSYFLYLGTGWSEVVINPVLVLADPATCSWLVQVHCVPSPTNPPRCSAPQLHHRFQPHHVFLYWVSTLWTHWQTTQG